MNSEKLGDHLQFLIEELDLITVINKATPKVKMKKSTYIGSKTAIVSVEQRKGQRDGEMLIVQLIHNNCNAIGQYALITHINRVVLSLQELMTI